ncbi:MAG: glycoside hydrolase family 25 [Hyphomicrobiales bacterium]|nr:glycoside hydrolase family 25 [Hyphomicrobiales bacterium]MDE2114689.1 glycoside hydrolase family 25 [Hyphomicrobiales bacterium]
MKVPFVSSLLLAGTAFALSGCSGAVGSDALAYQRFGRSHHHYVRHSERKVHISQKWTQALGYSKAFSIRGVDVSKFQGDVNWSEVHSAGMKFAYLKATEGGDRVDDNFRRNWEYSKAAGLRRGAYHFVYWCRGPMSQIKWFEAHVPKEANSLPPVLDVELTPTSPTCKRVLHRAPTQAAMREMLQELERHYGKKPIIYTTVDFYKGILSDNALSEYPIWVRSTKYKPNVPYGDRKWDFWQFQSDGNIAGIKGHVDVNAFAGDDKRWQAWLKPAKKQEKSLAASDGNDASEAGDKMALSDLDQQ